MTKSYTSEQQKTAFIRCHACGRILPQSEWGGFDPDIPSPCCSTLRAVRSNWPTPPIIKLLENVCEQDVNTFEGLELASVFLCFTVEMIIESILMENFRDASDTVWMVDLAFKNGRDLSTLLKLYEKVSGSSMANRFESLGAGDFMADIGQLVTLRNKMVSTPDYKPQQSERRSVLSVRDWCLKYFSMLSNQLLQKTYKKQLEGSLKKTKSILVVDDELVVLDYMCKLVKRQGLSVYGAATGREGINLFKEHLPDCVLLDIALPDMDGLSVLKEIRDISATAIVHLVTGIGGEAIEKEAKRLGSNGYVQKPVESGALIAIIKSL